MRYDISYYYTGNIVLYARSLVPIAKELRFLLALKLFELHRLTLGKAAEFCGMNKLRFMFEVGRLQVPVMNLDDDQIADA